MERKARCIMISLDEKISLLCVSVSKDNGLKDTHKTVNPNISRMWSWRPWGRSVACL